MARFFNKALLPLQKRLLLSYLQNTWVENPLNACEVARMCFLCTKSKGKQGANDFAVSRWSSHPTLDYFDTLKEAKLKSFKDLKAV